MRLAPAPVKHARFNSHLIGVSSEVLTTNRFDVSCTPVCFWTRFIWPKPDQAIQIRSLLILYVMIGAFFERIELNQMQEVGSDLYDPAPFWLYAGDNDHNWPQPKHFWTGSGMFIGLAPPPHPPLFFFLAFPWYFYVNEPFTNDHPSFHIIFSETISFIFPCEDCTENNVEGPLGKDVFSHISSWYIKIGYPCPNFQWFAATTHCLPLLLFVHLGSDGSPRAINQRYWFLIPYSTGQN